MTTPALTWPTDLQPCTTEGCSHLGLQHGIGTRKGARVRTACSTSSGPRGTQCPCRLFTPAKEA